MECILTFDVGTTSVKTGLFDFSLNRLCIVSEEYSLDAEGNVVEAEAEKYIDAIKKTIVKVKEIVPEAEIKAVTATTQGETLIPVSKEGETLRKAIVWLDSRADKEAEEISDKISKKHFARTTGLPEISGACPIAKLLWIKNNEQDIYNRCSKFLFLEDYIIFRLTGKFVTEKSLVSSSGYFDIDKDEYWEEILDVAGVSADKLPYLAECGENIGTLTGKAAAEFALPEDALVFTGAMDQVSSAIGAGALSENIVTETTGTALVVTSYSKERKNYSEKGITEYRHAIKGGYLNLAFSNTAGIVLKWFKDTFCADLQKNGISVYKQLDDMAKEIKPLCDGLMLFPHFEGTNFPEVDLNAKGVYFGIGLGTTRAHFVRALLEGVSYMLRENIDAMESDAEEIRSMGGASGSDIWCRIKADVTNRKMVTYDAESTSLGAAMLALCGMGVFSDIWKACEKAAPQKVYEPGESKDIYDEGYKKYLKMYDSFQKLFKE